VIPPKKLEADMTYIISIANEKGGVAKTTTALSLSAALVETGLEVLMIDLDAQSNLTLSLGLETSQIQHTVTNILLESIPATNAVTKTGFPRLDIIASNAEMGMAERFLPIRSGYMQILRTALRDTDWTYDYILIDCPPFLGATTINALTASDMLIMPTQAEFFSINALRNMMSMVKRVRAQGNAQLTYRLLLTMYDRRNRIHRTLSEQLRSTFGNGVLETIIETDTRLRESAIAGVPIIYHSPKTRAALQYRALAQEILTYVKETAPAQSA
jgi:chromosome partitioning protein